MELTPQEVQLLDNMIAYADQHGYALNPDREAVGRVIRGMVLLQQKKGETYCPCRMVTGRPEIDRKNICPCEHHPQEIATTGHCHCLLFFRKA